MGELDPGEVHDIAEDNPEKLAQLLAHWEWYVFETGTLGRACDWGPMAVPIACLKTRNGPDIR